MYDISVARKISLSALVALILLVGALFVAAPKASAGLGQCPYNAMCIWSQPQYQGQFSWWPAHDTGCHNHANNPNIRSAFNNMISYTARVGGFAILGPLTGHGYYPQNVTGLVCWPV